MKILPETQFAHSLEIVSLLGESYGIAVTKYEEATSGIENTTLIVTGTDSKYVFRIYRQAKKTNAQVHAEIDFMAYLDTNHIPVPPILPNSAGESITIFEAESQSWQLLVMEFIVGEHPDSKSAALLSDMATTQAHMHQLASGYTGRTGVIRKLTELVETEFIHQIDLTKLNNDTLRAFLERGTVYRVMLDAELPTGVCHLDYDEQNILCKGDTLTAVLDFDDMAIAPYAVCLAYTLWHIQDKQGAVAAQTYLRNYERVRPLTARERLFLPTAILFRHYMITAIKILEGKTSPKHVKSYLHVERSLLPSFRAGDENNVYHVHEWTPELKQAGDEIVVKIHQAAPELEVLFMGAAALGIPGQNDIDLDILCDSHDIKRYADALSPILGTPHKVNDEMAVWNYRRDGIEIDCILSDPSRSNSHIPGQKKVFELLSTDQELREHYAQLKYECDGLPYEQYKAKKKAFLQELEAL